VGVIHGRGQYTSKYGISLVTANKQQFNINRYIILLYYLSCTALRDIHIHAITTYHIMYLISVKIDNTLTVNQKKKKALSTAREAPADRPVRQFARRSVSASLG
jgi:hypothetical protein